MEMTNTTTFLGYTRSDPFHVKDEQAFNELMANTQTNGEPLRVTRHADGTVSFKANAAITGLMLAGKDQPDRDAFCHAMRGIVADNDACGFTEVLTENDTVIAYSVVITSNVIAHLSVDDQARQMRQNFINDLREQLTKKQ